MPRDQGAKVVGGAKKLNGVTKYAMDYDSVLHREQSQGQTLLKNTKEQRNRSKQIGFN